MELSGWLLDKSAAARSADERVRGQLSNLAGSLHLCPIGHLEHLYSTRSAEDYDALDDELRDTSSIIDARLDVGVGLSEFSCSSFPPLGTSTAMHDGDDYDGLLLNPIVDAEGKTVDQCSAHTSTNGRVHGWSLCY